MDAAWRPCWDSFPPQRRGGAGATGGAGSRGCQGPDFGDGGPGRASAEALFWLDGPHGAPGQLARNRIVRRFKATASVAAERRPSRPPWRAGCPRTGTGQCRRIDSNPDQPRQDFDQDIQSLAESLSTHGLLQPVVVRPVRSLPGRGGRTAASGGGPGRLGDVPVNVVEADDRQMAELAIVENLQRKDLNALEKAASFQRYLEQYGCTQEELAGRLKLDRSTIANLIGCWNCPSRCRTRFAGQDHPGPRPGPVAAGRRTGADRVLPADPAGRDERAADGDAGAGDDRRPIASRWRSVETPPKTSRSPRAKTEHVAALEQEFRAALGLKVKITHNARGRGKLVVQFRNHEEFERLKKQVCGK